ncbi:MAG: Lrp/AsnC family transcriptional regulator [archaeon]|nr:Lrp/AsnC family transcriptional regulator [archaeon]
MPITIDEKDKKILEVLKEHGDYTTRQIAKKTLLPITTIHHRIQKLKKEKVITRYTIELDNKKIDKGFSSYILISVNLPLLKQKKKTQYDIAKEVGKYDFVEKVDIVSGGTDLIALVRVKDVEEFDKVLLSKLQQIEGIEKTQSLIVIHSN